MTYRNPHRINIKDPGDDANETRIELDDRRVEPLSYSVSRQAGENYLVTLSFEIPSTHLQMKTGERMFYNYGDMH